MAWEDKNDTDYGDEEVMPQDAIDIDDYTPPQLIEKNGEYMVTVLWAKWGKKERYEDGVAMGEFVDQLSVAFFPHVEGVINAAPIVTRYPLPAPWEDDVARNKAKGKFHDLGAALGLFESGQKVSVEAFRPSLMKGKEAWAYLKLDKHWKTQEPEVKISNFVKKIDKK